MSINRGVILPLAEKLVFFMLLFRPELIALASIKPSKDWTVGSGFSVRLLTQSGKGQAVEEASIHAMFAHLF